MTTVVSIEVLHVNTEVVDDIVNTDPDRRTTFQKEVFKHWCAATLQATEESDTIKACAWLLENGIYKLVAHLSVKNERTEIALLELAWGLTNTIKRYWPENVNFVAGNTLTVFGKKHRSSSVGDLFILNRKKFVAVSFGFAELQ